MADFSSAQLPADDLGFTEATAGDVPAQQLSGQVADSTPPTIANILPTPGTPIDRSQAITFDVLDNVSAFRRVEVFVALGGDTFVVHDGDTFKGQFTNLSSRTPIAGGYHFSVRKNGGWIQPPSFEVHAVDTAGNEAS
jgi:hypothetical protein